MSNGIRSFDIISMLFVVKCDIDSYPGVIQCYMDKAKPH